MGVFKGVVSVWGQKKNFAAIELLDKKEETQITSE